MPVTYTLGQIASAIAPGQTHRHLHPIVGALFPDTSGGWRRFDFADAAVIALYVEMRRAGIAPEIARWTCKSDFTRDGLAQFLAIVDPADDPVAWLDWVRQHDPMIVVTYAIEGDLSDRRREMEVGAAFSARMVPAARLADAIAEMRTAGESVFATPLLPAFKALSQLLME